jgi:hypothetical protein
MQATNVSGAIESGTGLGIVEPGQPIHRTPGTQSLTAAATLIQAHPGLLIQAEEDGAASTSQLSDQVDTMRIFWRYSTNMIN